MKSIKEKLAYFISGGLLVTVGMTLSPVTAQKDKFGEIECTKLTVVDVDGKPLMALGIEEHGAFVIAGGKDGKSMAFLGIDEYGGRVSVGGKDGQLKAVLNISEHGGRVQVKSKGVGKVVSGVNESGQKDKFDTIQCSRLEVVDADGKPLVVLAIGEYGGGVGAYGKDGKSIAGLAISEHGGRVDVFDNDKGGLQAGLSIDEHGGRVDAYGKDGDSQVSLDITEHGGLANAYGKDGKSRAMLGIAEHGGFVSAHGKIKGKAIIGVNQSGNGAVSTWDKNGVRR